ncbi:MFS transporter [Chitinophaga pollutisoli]|uniref:MFS transporter n=1 Tax=Chitinophaga pollutisoli TaxID=3133966 RepID=A0ABZ2YR51_9BACT
MFDKTISLYKSAYGGIPRKVWLLATVLLINRAGAMVIPFLTLYLTTQLHFSLEQAGIVMTVYGVGSILGALLGGKLSDTIGFHPVQFWSLVLHGGMFVVLGQMHTFVQFAGAVFVLGLVGDAFRPANFAAVAHYSDAGSRLRSYSLLRLASNLGWAVGPAVGGMIAYLSYDLLFYFDATSCLLAALLLKLFLRPGKTADSIVHKAPGTGSVTSAYRDKLYLFFILLVAFNAVCLFQMFNIVPVYLKTVVRMPENLIGLAISFNGVIIALVEMILVFKLENRRANEYYICIGALFMGLAYIVFNFFPPVAAVAFIHIVLFSIAEMLTLPFMNNIWIHRAQAHNRGQYAALYTVAFSAATILAPTLGAFGVENFGYGKWWYAVGGISMLTFIGFYWLLVRKSFSRTAETPAQPAPGAILAQEA